jgi:hypothetical protein
MFWNCDIPQVTLDKVYDFWASALEPILDNL